VLAGIIFPDPDTVQPLGIPDMLVVLEATVERVADDVTQGQPV